MRITSSTGRLVKLLAAVGMVASGVVAAAPAASASTPAVSTPAASTPAAWSCSANYICFYTGSDGGGKRCQYSQSNAQADEICSWHLDKPRSVWNRSDSRVHYYAKHDFKDRIGSTAPGDRGNLAGTYNIRSIKFG
ncbi:peptidase inhibitor family I36 protein [Saccharothrix isguenensis]